MEETTFHMQQPNVEGVHTNFHLKRSRNVLAAGNFGRRSPEASGRGGTVAIATKVVLLHEDTGASVEFVCSENFRSQYRPREGNFAGGKRGEIEPAKPAARTRTGRVP